MVSALRSPGDALRGDRWLVLRAITVLVLGLLVCAGIFSSTHAEEGSSGTGTAVSVVTPELVADAPAGAAASAETVAVPTDGALGAAACFIGVLCTLLIFTLIRASRPPGVSGVSGARPHRCGRPTCDVRCAPCPCRAVRRPRRYRSSSCRFLEPENRVAVPLWAAPPPPSAGMMTCRFRVLGELRDSFFGGDACRRCGHPAGCVPY